MVTVCTVPDVPRQHCSPVLISTLFAADHFDGAVILQLNSALIILRRFPGPELSAFSCLVAWKSGSPIEVVPKLYA